MRAPRVQTASAVCFTRTSAALAAASAALLLTGCGGSSRPPASPHKSASQATVVEAKVIAVAARKTAAEPGYRLRLALSLEASKLDGQATVTGTGHFSNSPAAAQLNVSANLPSVLALISPLTTTAVLHGGHLDIRLPPKLEAEVKGAAKPWISVSAAEAGKLARLPNNNLLSGGLQLRAALDALAAASTGQARKVATERRAGQQLTRYSEHVKGLGKSNTLQVWIDHSTGLIERLSAIYEASGGQLQASVKVTFTAFGRQQIPAGPSADQTTSLTKLISGFSF